MTYSFDLIANETILEEVIDFNVIECAVINNGQCVFIDSDNENSQMIFDAEQFAAMMRPVELNRFVES